MRVPDDTAVDTRKLQSGYGEGPAKRVNMGVHVDQETRDRIFAAAIADGITVSEWLRRVIAKAL